MPNDIRTDAGLLARLRAAANHPLSSAQLHSQRVSFIYGNLSEESAITRAQVESELARIEGETVAA